MLEGQNKGRESKQLQDWSEELTQHELRQSECQIISGFPHNFQNQIKWHSMTFPWPLLHFFHACLSDTYICPALLKIADVALMGSNSAKLCSICVAYQNQTNIAININQLPTLPNIAI